MASSTRPAASCRPHDLFQTHRLWSKDEGVGDLGRIRQPAPGKPPLLPARLSPAERKLLPGPIVQAWPLTAFSCREALPSRGLPTGHDLIGTVGESTPLILRHRQHIGLEALLQPAA